MFNWSGGKDSALALQNIQKGNEFEVVSLLTTVEEETLKSSLHAIPLTLLSKQAESIGIPLHTIPFAKSLKNYDEKMREMIHHFRKRGVSHFIFGDISLSGMKAYRESKLNPFDIEVVEPLWNKSPEEVIHDFLESGIRAKIIVTHADKLPATFIGKELNAETISAFPEEIDICGENGEYHTLSFSGGIFKKEIAFSIENVEKISYDVKLDTGHIKKFTYWRANIHPERCSQNHLFL